MTDLLGTFVFALSDAAAGVKNKLDLFGLMVLAFATGSAGGITRDVLIGSIPPASIHDWRYLAICVLAGCVVFLRYPKLDAHRHPVLLLDAAGLAVFAVTGTQKSLAAGLNPLMAAFLGMLSGIGGGMLRDILVNETPVVLRADLYAVAALAAGALVVGGKRAAPCSPLGHDCGCAPLLLPKTHGDLPRLAPSDSAYSRGDLTAPMRLRREQKCGNRLGPVPASL